MAFFRLVPLALFAISAAGCTSTPSTGPRPADGSALQGAVGMKQFDPAGALDVDRLVLGVNESFLMPVGDLSNRPPTYPEARLADALPRQDVCLLLAVDEAGRVASAVDVTGRAECGAAGSAEPDFVSAAVQAAKGWRFDPAVRCVFRTAAAREDAANTGCAGADEIPQAVSLHYRFVFEQRDGRGAVRLMQ